MIKKYGMLIRFAISIGALSLVLVGCNGKSSHAGAKKEKIVTAALRSIVVHLPYSGTLNPLSTLSVLSPVDGRITQVKFTYGGYVKKGQTVAIIDSKALSDSFHKSIADFLQAKSDYNNEMTTFTGTQALYKAGVIQRNTFLTEQSTYQTKVFSFYQNKFQLEKILNQAHVDIPSIEKLSLSDTAEINKLLHQRFSHIVVTAEGSGVALFPIPGQNSDSDSNSNSTGKLMPGTQVKEGQLILSIGNLEGLSASLQVSEINVNRIKPGMPVTVTGDGFSGMTLHGTIQSVASQANPSQGGFGDSVSMFNVSIVIPTITESERKVIHVGMTCQIDIAIKEAPQVMIPLKALQRDSGSPTVIVLRASGTRETVPVMTGTTTPDGYVAILSGVKVGDRVIVHD